MNPFKLTPAFKDYIWGGERLKQQYGKQSEKDIIAESWELSAHPDGQSIIATGEYMGMGLGDFAAAQPELLGRGKKGGFPILIKLIDAARTLSIQVHPDNDYARRREGDAGKTEMWYILDSKPGAFIYYGFNKEISRDEMRQRIKCGSITDVLRRVEMQKGDVAFIPAGTIHAISEGLLIAEVQQSSNATYRVYDFGRMGADGRPRPLHIEKALDVTNLRPAGLQAPGSGSVSEGDGYKLSKLAKCEYFDTSLLQMDGGFSCDMDGSSFVSLLCIDGMAKLECGGDALPVEKGDSIFVPADNKEYKLSGRAECLVTTA